MRKLFALIILSACVFSASAKPLSVDSITGFRDVKFGDIIKDDAGFFIYTLDSGFRLDGTYERTSDDLMYEGIELTAIKYYAVIDKTVSAIELDFSRETQAETQSLYKYFVKLFETRYGKSVFAKTADKRGSESTDTNMRNITMKNEWVGNGVSVAIEFSTHKYQSKTISDINGELCHGRISFNHRKQ